MTIRYDRVATACLAMLIGASWVPSSAWAQFQGDNAAVASDTERLAAAIRKEAAKSAVAVHVDTGTGSFDEDMQCSIKTEETARAAAAPRKYTVSFMGSNGVWTDEAVVTLFPDNTAQLAVPATNEVLCRAKLKLLDYAPYLPPFLEARCVTSTSYNLVGSILDGVTFKHERGIEVDVVQGADGKVEGLSWANFNTAETPNAISPYCYTSDHAKVFADHFTSPSNP